MLFAAARIISGLHYLREVAGTAGASEAMFVSVPLVVAFVTVDDVAGPAVAHGDEVRGEARRIREDVGWREMGDSRCTGDGRRKGCSRKQVCRASAEQAVPLSA